MAVKGQGLAAQIHMGGGTGGGEPLPAGQQAQTAQVQPGGEGGKAVGQRGPACHGPGGALVGRGRNQRGEEGQHQRHRRRRAQSHQTVMFGIAGADQTGPKEDRQSAQQKHQGEMVGQPSGGQRGHQRQHRKTGRPPEGAAGEQRPADEIAQNQKG